MFLEEPFAMQDFTGLQLSIILQKSMRTEGLLLAILMSCCCVNHAYSQGNSLLWKISGNGLSSPSYLYGTMHTTDARVFKLADSVLMAFEYCDLFVMEVIIDDASKLNILQGLYMDTSYSLKKLLSPMQYDSVDQYCRKNTGQSIKNFERLKPVYTAAILSQSVYSQSDTAANAHQYFLDEYFQRQAMSQQKKVQGLETIAEQMLVFDVLSYPHQAELLMQTVRKTENDTKSYDQMVRYYLDNDLVKMMSFENDFSLPDSLYDGLITARNRRMADRMDTFMHRQSAFVAVGAGHLGEEEGIVNLLRDKGYTVLPVLPTYHNYLANGWYRKTAAKDQFKADFPEVPMVSTEQLHIGTVQRYSSTAAPYPTEQQDFSVYAGKGSIDSLLRPVLQHHFKMNVPENAISTESISDNHLQLILETTDGRHCAVQCFEKNNHVYIMLYTYKRKLNKEFRNRFFGSMQILF